MKSPDRKNAFTLIELMVVVIIIAALAGMVLPKILPASDEAKRKIAEGSMANIEVGLDLYRLHTGVYPSTEQGLNALMSQPGGVNEWRGPYLKKPPKDPWKRDFQYRYPGTRNQSGCDIWSLGADEQSPDDDIKNWQE